MSFWNRKYVTPREQLKATATKIKVYLTFCRHNKFVYGGNAGKET